MLTLASAADRDAAAFVCESRREGYDARLITPADLARPGWRLAVPDDGNTTLVAEGAPIRADAVHGVFVRLPHVGEPELDTIADTDRAYVAAECQAFLYAMLTALRCPVFNRPTPNCLAGRFIRVARTTVTRSVSVIGERAFGEPMLHESARRFASAAGLTIARVWFDDEQPVTADLWPNCAEAEVGTAIRELFPC